MAQRYNTGNPRPSNSMKDLNDNALAYDDFLNGEQDEAYDRFQKPFPTVRRQVADRIDEITGAQKSIEQYTDEAKQAADNAQNIADANTYYTTPEDPDGTIAGIAGTAEGKGFRVAIPDSTDNIYLFKYYKKESGTAVFINSEASYREIERLNNEIEIGHRIEWSNVNLTTFNEVNLNRVIFTSTSSAYQEAKGALASIPSGATVEVWFRLTLKSGVAPTLRLRGASDWASQSVRLTPSHGLLTATLTATADASEIRLYSDTGNTTDCDLYMFIMYGNESPITSTVTTLINEAQNSREYAERGVRSTGYSSFESSSPNTFKVTGDGTAYAEVRLSMLPIRSGGTFKFKHKIASTAGWTYARLFDSSTGKWASAETIIKTNDLWRTVEIATTADRMIDTVVIYTRTQTKPISASGFFNLLSVDGIYFSASQAYHDMPPDDIGIGMIPQLNNGPASANVAFDEFSVEVGNLFTMRTNTAKYAEARGDISVSSGKSVTFYYQLLNTAGGTPFIRLRNTAGNGWASAEYPLVFSPGLNSVTIAATADAGQAFIYCKNTQVSYNRLWGVMTGSPYTPETLLTERLASAILQSSAYVESARPVGSGFSSFTPTSNNSWRFASPGTAYSEAIVTIPQQPAGAKLRVMYAVKSNGANTYIRLRHAGGWASPETPIITDGARRFVDLQSDVGASAYEIRVYSRTQAAYWGTGFVALSAVNDIYLTSSTAANELTSDSSGSGAQQSTDVMFPSSVYLVAGRPVTLYGENFISGVREWLSGANMAISSTPAAGKPSVLRSALPDVTFRPEEIGGTTIEVNARADDTANVFRKSAAVRVATPVADETIKVCALMDSHGSICVPWLYRAVNSTGSVYQGVGMYSIEGIPFEGRAGWATFSYMGRRAEEQFTNPFLKIADANDKSSWPQWCYDTAYSGQSYADNPNLPSYHIFDVAAWAAARGLTAADKLVVVLQLGVNDRWRGYAATDVAAAQDFMITKFKAVLPQCRFVVSSHSIGWTSERDWSTYTPYIMQKIIKFDGRESQNILQSPAWAFMSAKYGWRETAVGTLPGGVVQVALNDDIHPTDLGAAQWADALVGGVIAAWHL
ncbi:SGNH/GDSL hydrolase family protein [Serratia marcescens]|uniref:SGNH/GDSL hydrolase family protein n=1 Tax=Serratia marcescens TaxID=615 RepID=UPI001153F51D|nr:SGNH/GDSL hydrolase family protein [Serratia marcescens]QDI22320.1 SGNH/GDSL hydrolase family protein [Serratia marcescens]